MTNTEKGKDLSAAVDKRDYLRSKGFTVGNRGRFSQAMKDAIAKAESEGVTFLDRGVETTTVITIDESGERKTVVRESNPFAHHPEPIREGHFLFVGEGKKKERTQVKINMSEACNTCKYSVGWCLCPVPTVTYWRTGEVLHLERSV